MTLNTVIHLADHKPNPHAAIIEMLEALLEEAKAGDISGIAVAYSSPSHSIATCYQYENWLLAVGAASLLHHDVLHSAGVAGDDD